MDIESSVLISFTVSIFYNNIYLDAVQSFKSKKFQSLEYAYQNSTRDFLNLFNNKKEVRALISEMLGNEKKYLKYDNFDKFTNNLCNNMVPRNVLSSLRGTEKEIVVYDIMQYLATEMGRFIHTEDILNKILTFHDSDVKKNIRILKDKALEIINNKRISYSKKVIGQDPENELISENRGLREKITILETAIGELRSKCKAIIESKNLEIKRLIAQINSPPVKMAAVPPPLPQIPAVVTPPSKKIELIETEENENDDEDSDSSSEDSESSEEKPNN